MASREMSRQVREGNPEYQQKIEKSTAAWGGMEGGEVQAMDTDVEEKVHGSLDFYYTHLSEKYQRDPESLSDAELAIAKVAQLKGNYKPREQAQVYSALGVIESQLGNPDSEFAKSKKLYEQDSEGNWQLTEQGQRYQDQLQLQRAEVFANLTGIDPVNDREGRIQYTRAIKAALKEGRYKEAIGVALLRPGSVEAAGDRLDAEDRLKNHAERGEEFTVQARVTAVQSEDLQGAKTRMRLKLERMVYQARHEADRFGRRTVDGALQAELQGKYELLLGMVDDAESLERLQEVTENSGEREKLAPMLEGSRKAEEIVLETMMASELDELVATATVREVSGNRETLEARIKELGEQITAETDNQRRVELQRQRAFLQESMNMLTGNTVDRLSSQKKNEVSVDSINGVMSGLERQDLVEGLAAELGVESDPSNPSPLEERVNKALKKQSKPSMLSALARMLNRGGGKGPRQTAGRGGRAGGGGRRAQSPRRPAAPAMTA